MTTLAAAVVAGGPEVRVRVSMHSTQRSDMVVLQLHTCWEAQRSCCACCACRNAEMLACMMADLACYGRACALAYRLLLIWQASCVAPCPGQQLSSRCDTRLQDCFCHTALLALILCAVTLSTAVQAASRGLHLLPTLDCLALSPDPAMKSRAAAALAALVTAGLVESEEARTRWRDMLLGWLISSTASTLKKPPSASSSSSSSAEEEEEDGSWFLSSWFKGSSSSSEKEGGDGADAANAALARSCVAALRGGSAVHSKRHMLSWCSYLCGAYRVRLSGVECSAADLAAVVKSRHAGSVASAGAHCCHQRFCFYVCPGPLHDALCSLSLLSLITCCCAAAACL